MNDQTTEEATYHFHAIEGAFCTADRAGSCETLKDHLVAANGKLHKSCKMQKYLLPVMDYSPALINQFY